MLESERRDLTSPLPPAHPMVCLTPATKLVGTEVKWIVVEVGAWAAVTAMNVAQAKKMFEKCISSWVLGVEC